VKSSHNGVAQFRHRERVLWAAPPWMLRRSDPLADDLTTGTSAVPERGAL
jgi:hypothetical protein